MRDIYLLKFGGNALGDDGMERLCREVAALTEEGVSIVMVHGGGPAINAEMERLGMKPVKVAGKRITDEAGLEVVEKVLRGINAEVVRWLEDAGVRAIGMPGYFLSECRRDGPQTVVDEGREVEVDYGLVGEVVKVDPQVVYDLVDERIVPVIYPVGSDGEQHLNVNADSMAAGIAAGIKVKEMIAITDVPGILRDVHDPSSKIDTVTLKQIERASCRERV